MAKRGRGKKRFRPQPSQPAASSSSGAQEAADTSQRISNLVDGALPIVQSTIKIVSEAVGDAAVPGLRIGLSALAEILEHIQTMKRTGEGVKTLVDRIEKLLEITTDFCSRPQALSKERKEQIEKLSRSWEDVAKQTEHIASRGRVKRFLLAKHDAEKLEGFVENLSNSIQQNFLLGSLLSIEVGVAQANENILEFRKDMRVFLDQSFMPTYAKGAQFDAFGPKNVRGACLKGTRVKTLEEVFEWITDACLREGATITRSIYWYNGWAGTGKTTIACSIAEWCLLKGILAASFFCSRFDAECSDPNSIFRTLSRQICSFSPPFKEKVIAILAKDSTIVHSAPLRQFKELILRPLQELKREHRPFPRCVIVIDALDECSDPDATSVILKILADSVPDIAFFLVFVVTSRPERHITYLFDSALRDATTPCLLHMIELKSVSNDIRHYLETCFIEVRGYFSLEDWPSSLALSRLVELSAGLFIWAATAIRFIRDKTFSDPEGQLNVLLSIQPASQGVEQTSGTILGSLYDQILQTALSEISEVLAQRLQIILGTIVLALEPLSVAALEGLTGTKSSLIRITLLKLHSVLHVPDHDHEPIRVIHPTFAEYLLRSPSSQSESCSPHTMVKRSSSSKMESLSINAAAHHAHLFSRTLGIMNSLEPNIARFPSHITLRSEILGLANTVKERIPPAVSYSCRHWSAHLEQCGNTEQMFDPLDKFFRTHALTWLEACSLLEALDSAVAALQTAYKACQDYGGSFAPLAEFISDCLRFTQTYYSCIDTAPLQLYQTLPALAPGVSLVRQQYAPEPKRSLLIARGAPPDWGPCVNIIVGHNNAKIRSVSFSADGAYFVTGGMDSYIHIWRTATRTSIKAISAGDGDRRVAFSPDGAYVASAPGLRIWDVKTGEVVRSLEHKDTKYVVYSADGVRLASGSDEQIKLWDPLKGTCVDIVTSVHAGSFNGMSISPNGNLVGGRTAEGYAAIYDTSSKGLEVLNQEQSDGVLAFSPDAHYAASCMSETVTIWSIEDGSLARIIDASSQVWGVMFSHDSTQIGCACQDRSVRIWTVASDDPPRVLAGHTDEVNALTWSPDDTQVISVSDDGTIRVWDLTRHRDDTTLAAFPPSSLPPLPGAPCYALFRTPKTTALFSLPAPIQPSTAASDAAEDAPNITLYADMADAWDAILRGAGASGEFAASRDWAFLTGRLHANINEVWPVAMTPDRSLSTYEPEAGEVQIHNHRSSDHPPLSLRSQPEALTFSADNSHLAAADSTTLSIWDVTSQSNNPVRRIEMDSFSHAVAYSHNGDLLVAGTPVGDAHIYDATTGQSAKHLPSTRGEVRRITFSTDDRHVVAQAHPWLTIWDVATGDKILEVTSDHLLHSFDFALDDTGILVPDGKGKTIKVKLWSPGERTWPVYAVKEDGWLYAKGPGNVWRLCWLPPEWRTVFSQGGPKLCALDFEQKRTVVFDVSHIPEYVKAWGAESEGVLI